MNIESPRFVISRVETYPQDTPGERASVAWRLTLAGREQEFSSYDTAAGIAARVLADPALLDAWRERRWPQ